MVDKDVKVEIISISKEINKGLSQIKGDMNSI